MDKEIDQIVFYDGDCGFCNRSVAYILRHEKDHVLKFASLQSAFTITLFKERGWKTPNLETFYYTENGLLYERSTAAMKIGRYMKFPGNLLRLLIIIPRPIRDWLYNGIAKRRHRIYSNFCYKPSEEEKTRFL